MNEVVNEVALDEKEIEQTLEKHQDRINSLEEKHGDRISNLEKDMEFVKTELKNMNGKMTDVKTSVDRMENTFMTQSSMMLQAFNTSSTNYAQIIQTLSTNNTQVATKINDNETKVLTETSKNQTAIDAKKIGLYGTMITGFIGLASLIVKAIFA